MNSPAVPETEPVSASRFFSRLRALLAARGLDIERLPAYTRIGDAPECFEWSGDDFDLWAAQASLIGALVPYRSDMPAEPNYCWDCTVAFKKAAMAAGKCRFPQTRFFKLRTAVGDKFEYEVVGVTRARHRPITEEQERSLLKQYY